MKISSSNAAVTFIHHFHTKKDPAAKTDSEVINAWRKKSTVEKKRTTTKYSIEDTSLSNGSENKIIFRAGTSVNYKRLNK